jgi:hypothetical protein
LRTTHPYGNFCGIDLKKFKFYDLIEELRVYLQEFPHIKININVVVIDVPYSLGMLFLRSWSSTLGGFLSMDLTHVHIPMEDGTFDILYSKC